MNMETVENHTSKAMFVGELAEKVKGEAVVSNQPVVKPGEVPFNLEQLAHVNEPYSVEGHLQKWRGTAK